MVRVDSHVGSPVGLLSAPTTSTSTWLCAHLPQGRIWEASQHSHPRRDRAVGEEGSTGERLVPVGALKEIQFLLVPLLEIFQQQFVLCPLQLQHSDLPVTRRESPCAALGTELPQQHLVAIGVSGQGGFTSLPCHRDAIGTGYGSFSSLWVTRGPPFSRQWGSPGSPALPHGPGRSAALPGSLMHPHGAGLREPPASSHAASPGLRTLPTRMEREDRGPSGSVALWCGHQPPKEGTCLTCSCGAAWTCALGAGTCGDTGMLSGR